MTEQQTVHEVQVDPAKVMDRYKTELGNWIQRALIAEEAVASLQAAANQKTALEVQKKLDAISSADKAEKGDAG